jgi:hypothetical protein
VALIVVEPSHSRVKVDGEIERDVGMKTIGETVLVRIPLLPEYTLSPAKVAVIVTVV